MKLLKTLLFFALIFPLANAGEEKPSPKACPFGHTTLTHEILTGDLLPGSKSFQCTTCEFRHFELNPRPIWGSVVLSAEQIFKLPEYPVLLLNLPTPPADKIRPDYNVFSQERTDSGVISNRRTYHADVEFDAIKAHFRSYFSKSGIEAKEATSTSLDSPNIYFYARVGENFLSASIIKWTSDTHVHVSAVLFASSELKHNFDLRNALGIDSKESAPISTN